MILSATLTLRHDDGTIQEYDCPVDDVIVIDDAVQVFTDATPVTRPRFAPGTEVGIRQSPTQVYTVVDGHIEEGLIRLERGSGTVFLAPVADLRINVKGRV